MDIRELIEWLEQFADQYGDNQRVIVIYNSTPTSYLSCSHFSVEVSAPGEVAITCDF